MTIEGGAWGAFVRTALGVVTYSTINRLPWTKRYGKHTQRDPSKTGDRGEDMCLAPLPSPHTPLALLSSSSSLSLSFTQRMGSDAQTLCWRYAEGSTVSIPSLNRVYGLF